jgi:parallel beta-helix repeat protein
MSLSFRAVALLPLLALTACESIIEDIVANPCLGVSGNCVRIAAGSSEGAVIKALLEAKPGDTIAFEEGKYAFKRGLSLDQDDVTIKGMGMEKTILSFRGQEAGAEGLLVKGSNFRIHDIAIEDTAGDALKLEGVKGVKIQHVRTEWTDGPLETNGAYGLYPVQCEDVLIEDSVAIGASDAGIYVGQSKNIIVRRNRAESNVAGIEIENSHDADVYENIATKNTGGLLVFSLPGLQVPDVQNVRVFDNEVYENNTDNFAPKGNIVGSVPTGTGIMIMSSTNVEVFDNQIRDNQTLNVLLVSYLTTGLEITDENYDPHLRKIYVHDNTITGGGDKPGGSGKGTRRPGDNDALLISAAIERGGPGQDPIPDIAWDGYLSDASAATNADLPEEAKICIQNNGDADYVNMDVEHDAENHTFDVTPHDCSHPAIEAVKISGVE